MVALELGYLRDRDTVGLGLSSRYGYVSARFMLLLGLSKGLGSLGFVCQVSDFQFQGFCNFLSLNLLACEFNI